MRLTVKYLSIVLIVLCLMSCETNVLRTKKIQVIIPQHPWETEESVKLWYSLKWNNNGKIESLYVDTETRKIEIEISKKGTVYICAYPLGEMLPFGTAVTPADRKKEVVLDQNEGYLAHLLINSNLDAAEHVNCKKLIQIIREKTDDFRNIEDTTLVVDVMNGCLDKSSVEIRRKYLIDPISIPNGRWIGEYYADGVLDIKENKTLSMEMVPGVFRFYCPELDREFRIALDIDGSLFYSIRYGMIGL